MSAPADMNADTLEVRRVDSSRTPWAVCYGRQRVGVPPGGVPAKGVAPMDGGGAGKPKHYALKREAVAARLSLLDYLHGVRVGS